MRKSAVWSLDFSEDTVIASVAEEKASGEWALLGLGEARLQGVKSGKIQKLTDAVESTVEALRKAERVSGRRCKKLFYTFDDTGMESAHPRGVKILAGEGQIARSDVSEAAQNAIRLVGDFKKTPVYSRQINYVIDDKDSVTNPVGIFGHRLDVVLHVLLAQAENLEIWKKLMRRAEIVQAVPVPSLVAVFYGAAEREGSRQIVWFLRGGIVSGGLVQKNLLMEYTVFLKSSLGWPGLGEKIENISRSWAESYEIQGPLFLGGELAARVGSLQKVFEESPLKKVAWSSSGSAPIEDSRLMPLAGLLNLAFEAQRKGPRAKTNKDLLGQVRARASAFIQEYF